MLKRNADWLEKMSVAAMAVGLFQLYFWAMFVGIACYAGSLYISRKLGG